MNPTSKNQPTENKQVNPSPAAPVIEKKNKTVPGFLTQVKLKPVKVKNIEPKKAPEPKEEKQTAEIIPEDVKIAIPKTLTKIEVAKEEPRSHSNKPSLKSSPMKENLQGGHELPDVPTGFSFKKKIYPSGSKRGLKVDPSNSMAEEIVKELEKQLAKAKLDEDFERCVELKRKMMELKSEAIK